MRIEEFKDKNILITGGCGFIGSQIVEYFRSLGSYIYVFGTDQFKFNKTFDNQKNLKFIQHDFKNENDALEDKIKENCERIDVLINNAYYVKPSSPLGSSRKDFVDSLDGTVGIYYETIKSCIQKMPAGSKIINIGSMYGKIIPDFEMYESEEKINPVSYGVGKSGVSHLTKYISNYLAKSKITVNCVLPGAMPNLSARKDKKFMSEIIKRTPLERLGNPTDLFGILHLLSSENGNFITGQCICVDGGFSNLK